MKKLSDYVKIMQVLEAKGVSVNQAEIDIGVKPGVIGKLEKRRNGFGRMHRTNTENFLRMFHVNPKWWEKGEGEMFLSEPKDLKNDINMDKDSMEKNEPMKTMPLDVWRQLEKNFDQFAVNAEFAKSEAMFLREVIRNMQRNSVDSNKG